VSSISLWSYPFAATRSTIARSASRKDQRLARRRLRRGGDELIEGEELLNYGILGHQGKHIRVAPLEQLDEAAQRFPMKKVDACQQAPGDLFQVLVGLAVQPLCEMVDLDQELLVGLEGHPMAGRAGRSGVRRIE